MEDEIMPYVHLTTNKNLSDNEKVDIKNYIIDAIQVIPGKGISNTMVQIDNAYMFFKQDDAKCIFIDLRVYKKQEEIHKQEFINKMCEYLKEKLGIEKESIYFNILELDSWVTNGLIK